MGRSGARPVVFVDYLQVLKPIDLRMTEKQPVDLTIVELKRLSRDLDLPVIAVSSFNRANYKTDVAFEAFKESGAIEYTADVVLTMQLRKNGDDDINELKNREPRPLELVLLKNRRGRAYQVIDVDYWPKQNYFTRFNKECCKHHYENQKTAPYLLLLVSNDIYFIIKKSLAQ